MRTIALFALPLLSALLLGSGGVAACDKTAASRAFFMLSDPNITRSRAMERDVLVYRWGPDFAGWSRATQLQMARTAADADACLTGQAREIHFYSPAGKLVTTASPSSGIRMRD